MAIYIPFSFDQRFIDLIFYLKSKYGEEIFSLEGIGNEDLNLPVFAKKFFQTDIRNKSVSDKSIDSNANIADNPSVINFTTESVKPHFKLNSIYNLWKESIKLYNTEIANQLIESSIIGEIYINDSTNLLMPYCYNYSTLDLATKGLPAVNKISSDSPKHLMSFLGQLENFIIIAANNTLGATGIADLLVTLSIYMDRVLKTMKDTSFSFSSTEDCWNYLKENIISFIYIVNQNFRSTQSAFTNISLYDREFLKEMISPYKLLLNDELYEAKIENILKIQEIYIDSFNEILKRTPCTFPVTTSCHAITSDYEVIDKEFLKMIANKNKEFGFINIYAGKSSTLSSCCRLRSEKNNDYFNSIGGTSSKIGSIGVCTINMPRLAFKNRGNEEKFFEQLKDLIWKAQRINNSKRHILKRLVENKNLPLYDFEFMSLDTQYSTIGINGLFECITEMGYDILNDEGINFQLKIIDFINKENDILSKKYNQPTNCEQIPGETVSIKLAKKDQLLGYNDKYEIYSNQFIPLTNDANILDRIRIQGIFDKHFSGGSILHLNIGNKIEDTETLYNLMKNTIKKGVIYFAVNYVLLQCKNKHMSIGSNNSIKCKCGEEIINKYSRIVGFLASTKTWHWKRREIDFPNRKFYEGV